MKRITGIFLLSCLALKLSAQVTDEKKSSTLVLHVFYSDFNTAQLIRTTSFGNVFTNNLWSRIGDMQMGFGVSYLKGLSKKIDFVSSLDGSSTDYLYKDGTHNGSNQFLLDINAGLNIKLLSDRHTVVPYLSTGAGVSLYQGKTGFYFPAGIGVQLNLFNEAFVFTNMQYRRALGGQANDHFQYNIGIGVGIGKKKVIKQPINPPQPVNPVKVKQDTTPVAKLAVKNVVITVTDEQTGFPLSSVAVTIDGAGGNMNAFTDNMGQVTFSNVQAGEYTVSGTLHTIGTTGRTITRSSFDAPGSEIKISITHNDPRFTLSGVVVNTITGQPEGDIAIDIMNATLNTNVSGLSEPATGVFNIQLEPGSDFVVSGKKAGYISDIEKVSTKGLTRSATLYVKLKIGIEQATPDKTITLSNIYYNTGSFRINPGASTDLEKLVKFLKDNPGVTIEIDSHTDSRGSASRNLKLSRARAQQVVEYLQKQSIAKNRLVAKGYGATRLVNGCKVGVKCTDAEHAKNRRTELKILAF